MELRIADHGKGLPADFDVNARQKSFGMRVVSSLLVQLNATMSLERGNKGTAFILNSTRKRRPVPRARRGYRERRCPTRWNP